MGGNQLNVFETTVGASNLQQVFGPLLASPVGTVGNFVAG
jgi:hypothetical protein